MQSKNRARMQLKILSDPGRDTRSVNAEKDWWNYILMTNIWHIERWKAILNTCIRMSIVICH